MSIEKAIVSILQERIGFNPESIGSDKVLSSVRDWLKGKTISDPQQYLESLRHGGQAFQEIVDAVIVPETWFFRDGEPFELLKRFAFDWSAKSKERKLRCLSMPCSTGEEPYSIAMALLDAGLPPERFSVEALDICPALLERARQGIYGSYSFRSADLSFRERHFEPRGDRFHLRKNVRDCVRFHHGNLLDPLLMRDGREYEVVFCRNLLIYFDPPSWIQALKTLHRLLSDSGLLFVGHAEMLDLSSPDFESVRFPNGFAYRKRVPSARVPAGKASAAARAPSRHRAAGSGRKNTTRVHLKTSSRQKPVAAAPSNIRKSGLKEAGELADAGRLVEAEAICAEHLTANPGSAPAYYLMGLIRQAAGKPVEAEEHYRRALYLDSMHHEAMIHLALLLEGRGDSDGAAHLRRRAARVRPPA